MPMALRAGERHRPPRAASYVYPMPRLPLFLLLFLVLVSCQPDIRYEASDAVIRTGDDPRWATRRYDDSGWRPEREATGNQVFWVRSWLSFRQRDTTQPLGLLVRGFGSFEVYWDGTLLGHNGRPASATQAEVPGTESSSYLVPDSLARPGRHVVALRATQAHLDHGQRPIQMQVQTYPRLLRDPLLIMAGMNLIAGALLLTALYYLFLFVNSSRKEHGALVFSVIGFLSFALLISEYAKFYVDIPYPQFYVRLTIIGLLTFAVSLLVPLYFTIQFGLPRKRLIMGILLAVLLGIYVVCYQQYDLTAVLLSLAMWVASVTIVLLAIRRKSKGGGLVLLGLLASALSYYYLYFDFSLYITFAIIVVCMLYLHTVRVRGIETERQSAQLRASRLQLELLKKNIQPHFIRNTLTSMLDWVEESPTQGAVFIQALAREFDLLNDIAEATLIPLGKELELCRHHLQVMQFRKEIRYELEESGLDHAALVPPAVFHTILENGITHSLPPADGRICFRLSGERTRQHDQYTLLTCARNRPEETRARLGSGTGFQYVKARLQESFGSNWEFSSEAVPEGWCTRITIARTA